MPGDPDREHTPPPASDPTDAEPKGPAQEKFGNGGHGEKLTKSLTAKTKKTRYRDPLRTLQTPQKCREKKSPKQTVKRKFRKSLTAKTRETKHRDPLGRKVLPLGP